MENGTPTVIGAPFTLFLIFILKDSDACKLNDMLKNINTIRKEFILLIFIVDFFVSPFFVRYSKVFHY